MELRQLAIFREVARCASFTRAAEALNYAQSNVTTQIKALESNLAYGYSNGLARRLC